jgi:hypothetical protein
VRAYGEPGPRTICCDTGRAWKSSARSNALASACSRPEQQRPHRDPQRQLARPGVEVELGPPEPGGGGLRLLDHGVRDAEHRLAVERRQQQPPHLAVVAAVDVEHAVAEQRPQVAEPPAAPLEGVEVGHEDLVVGLGADRPHDGQVERPDREHRPVAALVVEQHRQRVGDRVARVPPAGGQAARRQRSAPPRGDLAADLARKRAYDRRVQRRRHGRADLTHGRHCGI